jgi:putative ABC transport system permease protein
MSEFLRKLQWLKRRRQKDAELREELEFHLAEQTEEGKAAGLSEPQARSAAQRDFGNVTRIAEDTRAKWGWPVLEQFVRDAMFAWRTLWRAPSFTAAVVLTLALGVGSTSAIFSVVRGVLLKPLPYRDPDRVVSLFETKQKANNPRNVIAPGNFVEWRARSRTLEQIGMTGSSRKNLMLDGQPEEVTGRFASSDVFRALGAPAVRGRTFLPEEDEAGKNQVVILSYEFWQSRLHRRDDIIGLKILMDGEPRTVIGVMPPEFTINGQKADYFITYGWTMEALRSEPGRGGSYAIARLRDGVTFPQAAAEMKNIATQLEKEFPDRDTGWTVNLVPVHELTVEQIRPAILVLSGAVALVLLIACVNVANLLLARTTVRKRELGLRAALGAGRFRLIRQMLTESLLLAVLGGVSGLALAFAFHRGLLNLVTDRIPVPRLNQVTLDLGVVVVTLGIALGTGLLFGVGPAIVASRDLDGSLREDGRHSAGLRSRRVLGAHVVTEIAFALVLLIGAGLLIRGLLRLQEVHPGFRSAGLLTARVALPRARYSDEPRRTAFFQDALAKMWAAPDVQSAAGTAFLPMAAPPIGTTFYRADRPVPAPGERRSGDVRPITPGFFRTMGIPLFAGRDFAASDTSRTKPVVVISETLARRFFAGENPIGRQLIVRLDPPYRPWEIVGVVGDIKGNSLDQDIRPSVWIPHTQLSPGQMTFLIRTEQDPLSLVSTVRQSIRALDPELPLTDVMTMDEVVAKTLVRPRTVARLLSVFALMALVLAGVGVYGVMTYAVAQRTQEMGIRIALGASRSTLVWTIFGETLRLSSIGLGIGLAGAFVLTRLLETRLIGVTIDDPLAFASVTALLGVTALIASLVPAWRAASVDPLVALRVE